MIPIRINTQPNDVTCGPTSLHAVYEYYGDAISLAQTIKEVSYLEDGGTLAVMLALHALKRGYSATIYPYNLEIFDPSWFAEHHKIANKLKEQLLHKRKKKLHEATSAYLEYLERGGVLKYEDLSSGLMKKYFDKNVPILTGLSATYLYQCKREYTDKNERAIYDDVRGTPTGHFIILCGYDEERRHVVVADPYKENPVSGDNYYSVRSGRIINSIMLGIATYDANLLIIQPK